MNFTLYVSPDNTSYNALELFENQELFYEASFYDDVEVDSLKIPFYTSINIPLTAGNKAILGYDPLVNDVASYPTNEHFFIIEFHNTSGTEIRGVLSYKSFEYNSSAPFIEVELKDFLSAFIADMKDKGLGDILTSSYHTSRHTMSDFLDTTANGGEAGIANTAPDYTRIVNFPFIDFANDVEKFSFEARQFTEYGSGMERTGLVPSLSVAQYLKQIGTYLSQTYGSVQVKSKLFGINETAAIPAFEPEKLQAIIPAKLLAKNNTNRRQFQLTQAPSRAYPNENLEATKDLDGNTKLIKTVHNGDGDSFGNYGLTGYSMQKYGIKQQNQYSIPLYDSNEERYINELGYFCPHMSFKGKVQFLSGDRFETTGLLYYDVPVIEEDKMVYKINTASSTMKFGLFITIYSDGYAQKKIRLNDSNGIPIVLEASNATAIRGNSPKAQNEYSSTGFLIDDAYSSVARINTLTYPGIQDKLQFASQDAYLPNDSDLEIDIYGDSRYGVSVTIEPISGALNIQYVSGYSPPIPDGNQYVAYANAMTTDDFQINDIRKAETEVTNYGDLNLLMASREDFNPYFLSDEFIIKDSLNDSCELDPVSFISIIAKRFGCALMYEWDGSNHIIRIDPLHLIRTSSVDGNFFLDDLKSVKIYKPSDAIKNLILLNADNGLYYDKLTESSEYSIGSISRELNPNGVSDLKYEFKSSIYYKSLCGDVMYEQNDNAEWNIVTETELGTTTNLFTRYNEFDVRFAYLINPLYETRIKTPYVISRELRPNLLTETQRIYVQMYDFDTSTIADNHVFNGRLTHQNASGWNLMFENVLEQETDMYSYFLSTEQVQSKSKASVEFSVVFPSSYLNSVSFMLTKYYFGLFNSQSVLIKEVNGEVYDDNVYLDVKGLIE